MKSKICTFESIPGKEGILFSRRGKFKFNKLTSKKKVSMEFPFSFGMFILYVNIN